MQYNGRAPKDSLPCDRQRTAGHKGVEDSKKPCRSQLPEREGCVAEPSEPAEYAIV